MRFLCTHCRQQFEADPSRVITESAKHAKTAGHPTAPYKVATSQKTTPTAPHTHPKLAPKKGLTIEQGCGLGCLGIIALALIIGAFSSGSSNGVDPAPAQPSQYEQPKDPGAGYGSLCEGEDFANYDDCINKP